MRSEQADGIQVYQIDDIRLHLSKIEAYSFDNLKKYAILCIVLD